MAALSTYAPIAWPLALLGIGLLLQGVLRAIGVARQPHRHPNALLTGMAGFRRAMIGLALAGLGAGLALQQPWLVALGLGVGGEETLESSAILWALRRRAAAGT